MRIAVLGATGQIGRYVVKQLQQDHPNAEILACSRKPAKGHFLFRPFDDDWYQLGKVDVLVNSIGIIEPTSELSFAKAHMGMTAIILKNRQIIGDPRIIQVSVLGADEVSSSPFLSTKANADRMLLNHPNSVVVRSSIVCTPGTVIVQKMKLLKKISKYFASYLPFPASLLKTKIQPIMGQDLASIISNLCTSQNSGVIEIVGPEEISIRQLIKLLSPDIKIIAINQKLADLSMSILCKVFPGFINKSQYELLFADNIGDRKETEKHLNKPLQSTMNFWKSELR